VPVADATVDLGGARLTPGLVDLHSHGAGGASWDDDLADVESGLAVHRAHGTTRSVLSLVSAPLPRLRRSLERVATLRERDPLVLGAHLEGPFLAPGRRGAHDPRHLVAPTAEAVDALLAAAPGVLRQVTVAPELPGGLEAIERLVAAGVVAAVGHTEADHALAAEAFERGATVLTHALNAMPGLHHREPGPVGAAIADERVTLELVLDGRHVHPQVAALLFAAAPGRVALVTDAMAAAGAGDGEHLLGGLAVTVTDGRAVLAGTDTLAGSTLTQDAALRLALGPARQSPVAAVTAAWFGGEDVVRRHQRRHTMPTAPPRARACGPRSRRARPSGRPASSPRRAPRSAGAHPSRPRCDRRLRRARRPPPTGR